MSISPVLLPEYRRLERQGAKSKVAPTRSRSQKETEECVNRSMLEKHLQQAEEHVKLGRQHLARQMAVITKLEQAGRNTRVARELLETFELLQGTHEADRDRLKKELVRAVQSSQLRLQRCPAPGTKNIS
jgi:hypothetical protein